MSTPEILTPKYQLKVALRGTCIGTRIANTIAITINVSN